MTMSLRDRVTDFLIHEAELLDDRRFMEWAALYAADGVYWAPTDPAADRPEGRLNHLWDDRDLIEVRAVRLSQPDVIPQTPPSRASRLVGNVRVTQEGDEVLARSTLHMAEYRVRRGEPADDERIWAARVQHRLRPHGDSFLIRCKRVDLINAEAGLRAISVPF